MQFDQEINPEAVLKTVKVTGAKTARDQARDAGRDRKDGSIKYYAQQAQPKRWVAFRAVTNEGLTENALPADAAINVTVLKGTASAEVR
ncbi:MAG: hypothetical protein IPJ30_14345 [Acidobacteria bacterium]|nr:hypothetical protein [Acidobacteriota bacterium]